jgi:hypothetical protein
VAHLHLGNRLHDAAGDPVGRRVALVVEEIDVLEEDGEEHGVGVQTGSRVVPGDGEEPGDLGAGALRISPEAPHLLDHGRVEAARHLSRGPGRGSESGRP